MTHLLILSIFNPGEADRSIENWKHKVPYTCPPGCGICCSEFEPSILPVEAELIGAYRIEVKRELIRLLSNNHSENDKALSCLFYSPSYAGSCSIYPVRPLICRLFGYGAVRDKSGEAVYRLCVHIPGKTEPGKMQVTQRQFREADLRNLFHALPPVMQDYSTLLESKKGA